MPTVKMLDLKELYYNMVSTRYNVIEMNYIVLDQLIDKFDAKNCSENIYYSKFLDTKYIETIDLDTDNIGNEYIAFNHTMLGYIEIYNNGEIKGIMEDYKYAYITDINYINSQIKNILNFKDKQELGSLRISYIDEEYGKKFIFLTYLEDIDANYEDEGITLELFSNEFAVTFFERYDDGSIEMTLATSKDPEWMDSGDYIKYNVINITPFPKYED